MSEYDEAHGINRQPSGAAASVGGQFDKKFHRDADPRVQLSDFAGPSSTVPVTVGVCWMEYGVIPKGKRKLRNVEHRENVEIPVRAVTDEEAPLAIGKARFFEGRFYQPGDHWSPTYDDERLGVSYREMAPYSAAFTTDPDAERQAEIDKIAAEYEDMIYVDGVPYRECGEPHYVAEPRSLHGFVDVSYDKPEYASENLFRADQLDEALRHVNQEKLFVSVEKLTVHDRSVLGTGLKPVLDLGYDEDVYLGSLPPAERPRQARRVLAGIAANAPRTAEGDGIDFTALTYGQRWDYKYAVQELIEAGAPLTVADDLGDRDA